MSIADQVLAILASVAEDDSLSVELDTRLYDEHILDSLSTVELIVAFSQQFGIEIAPSAWTPDQWATPRKIVQYVEQTTRS